MTNTLDWERHELIAADERILAANKRIAAQEQRVCDSHNLGRDTRPGEDLLLSMRRLLETMLVSRQQIVEEIDRQMRLLPQPHDPPTSE